MVSFSCESCGDIMTKKKLDPHKNRCRGSTFTCIDCMTHFPGFDYRAHTSCISEAQKYQGKLYKEKPAKGKSGKQGNAAAVAAPAVPEPAVIETPAKDALVAAADTANVSAVQADKSKTGKKRKRDEPVAASPEEIGPTAGIETVEDDPKPSKKTKKAKKDKSLTSREDAAEGQPAGIESGPVSSKKSSPGQEGRSLLESFETVAKKELASRDEIDMARIIKKWQKKNSGAELEKLWKALKVRRNGEDELVLC